MKPYPTTCCHACAVAAGGQPSKRDSTFHMAICPVCGVEKPVTEPRDYCYPVFSGFLPHEWLYKKDDLYD